ncbi:MAG TPA: PIN domain-containing protein [Solirubrobacteraceae bacterium]
MTTRPEMLGDTSAWIALRRGRAEQVAAVRAVLRKGLMATCAPVRLELLRGARSRLELAAMRQRLSLLSSCAVQASTWARAEEVLALLAARRGGRHRGMPPMDLLIAAIAEAHALPVLHDDEHFELIAQVTGQPMLRLA